MATTTHPVIFDKLTELKDAGLVAASAAATVASNAKVVDLGEAAAEGFLVVKTTAVEVASGDEGYMIALQGSDDPTFATGKVNLAILNVGCDSIIDESADSPAAGIYKLVWRNEKNGEVYRYVRIYTTVQGAVATGINFTAFLTKHTY